MRAQGKEVRFFTDANVNLADYDETGKNQPHSDIEAVKTTMTWGLPAGVALARAIDKGLLPGFMAEDISVISAKNDHELPDDVMEYNKFGEDFYEDITNHMDGAIAYARHKAMPKIEIPPYTPITQLPENVVNPYPKALDEAPVVFIFHRVGDKPSPLGGNSL